MTGPLGPPSGPLGPAPGVGKAPAAPGDPAPSDDLDVLHVDMDCFFAAVEVLDDPSLAGLSVIVGGTGPRGVVASCSYEARATGVRSAMPMAEARRRCPSAVVLAGRHDRYAEVSAELHSVLGCFTPVIEPISLDEAFLDVSGSHRLFGSSLEIGHAIRRSVGEELRLGCSVGVARSKLIAKLASRAAKPKADPAGPRPGPGVVAIAAAEELAFLHPRPVRDLSGVGPRTADRLATYGVHTIGELAALDRLALRRIVGRAAGDQLHALAGGHDDRPVVADRAIKSIGHEETFPTDRFEVRPLRTELVRLSDSVGSRLRAAGVTGRTVTLKVRFGDFSTITRSRSLATPLRSATEIARVSCSLLEALDVSPGVRLIGVSVSSLEEKRPDGGEQLELLGPWEKAESTTPGAGTVRDAAAREDVDTAVGAIRARFGAGAVGPAAVAGPDGVRVKRPGDAPWGPSDRPDPA